MSLDDLTAVQIVRTLSGRPRYPWRPEGEAYMAKTLMECCINEAHARAVIAEFDEGFPTPAEVRSVAVNIRRRFDSGPKSLCTQCENGSGWKMVTINGIGYATDCVCRRPNAAATQPPIEFPGRKTKIGS